MAKVRGTTASSSPKRRSRPQIDPEAREMQMAALAMDLVEQRLRDGTASSQETTYFLKLVSTKAQLENEKLRKENLLMEAKTEALQDSKEYKAIVQDALNAMLNYQGRGNQDEY